MTSGTSIFYSFCLFCTTVNYETLYWLFSTIAQSYGAITGILGLFVVYRFEHQSKVRDDIRTRVVQDETLKKKDDKDDWLSSSIVKIFGSGVYGMSPDDFNDHYQHKMTLEQKAALQQLKETKTLAYNNLHAEMKRINNSIGITKRLQKSSFAFFPFHFFLVLAAIICVFFSHGLAPLCGWVFGITILLLLISSVVTTILGRDLVRTTAKKSFPFEDPLK